MKFSVDWFSFNINNFKWIKEQFPEKKEVLEIGCFEGRASCWMLENLFVDVDGTLTCVDTFEGSVEHAGMQGLDTLYDTWKANTDEAVGAAQTVNVWRGPSHIVLPTLIAHADKYDFIYVDGSHTAPDVLSDAIMAYHLCKVGGIILFDDYTWRGVHGILNQPKLAIDTFTTVYTDKVQILFVNHQLAVRKIL